MQVAKRAASHFLQTGWVLFASPQPGGKSDVPCARWGAQTAPEATTDSALHAFPTNDEALATRSWGTGREELAPPPPTPPSVKPTTKQTVRIVGLGKLDGEEVPGVEDAQ